MRSSTETLIAAMRILSRDIKSTDGIANAAIAEAAERLEELDDSLAEARQYMKGMVDAGDLQAAERRAESAEFLLGALRKADAERAEKLRELSRQWKEGADAGARDPWVFINDLDRILEET